MIGALAALLLSVGGGMYGGTGYTDAQAVSANFVPGWTPRGPSTWESLLALQPCSQTWLNYYAQVNDLYGSVSGLLRCDNFGTFGYAWRPLNTSYAATKTVAGPTASLNCLADAPNTALVGALSTSITITLNTINCWPGAGFNVTNGATLGAFNVTLTGFVGGVTKGINSIGSVNSAYDATGWRPY